MTGGDTYHYTTEDTFDGLKTSLRVFHILFLALPKTTILTFLELQQINFYAQQTWALNQRTPRPTATDISEFISTLRDPFADDL